jgi:uncharacterized SAM-binding protein YcdF (DUF218 family)
MTAVYFAVTKILLQPLPLLLLMVGAGLGSLFRRYGWRRRLCALAPLLALAAASTPAVVFPIVGALEWRYPPLKVVPSDAVALVVLGGGILAADQGRTRPELTDDTISRCLHAAELYRRAGPRLVIVTGGVLTPGSGEPPAAPAMRDLLIQLGVDEDDVMVEGRATTTYENATETRALLAARGLSDRRVVVVTEATHMPRAMSCFRNVGINAVAAPCRLRSSEFKRELSSFVPTPYALEALTAAVHEWIGLAWYHVRGRT